MIWVLLGLSALTAALYGFWLGQQQVSMARSASKTAAIGALACISATSDGPWLLTAALGFSALGDYFLSRENDKAFLAGMAAFFLAHLAYIPLFLQLGEGFDLIAARWPIALGFGLYALIFYRILWPGLGGFRLPVLGYCAAITGMGLAALGLALSGGALFVLLGALAFVLSDTVLALEKFRLPAASKTKPFAAYFVWFSYWLAQCLITFGTLYP
jgi:uncharacterized membrane protein YhhN